MLAVKCLCSVEICPLYPSFLQGFYYKGRCSESFSASNKMIMWFLSFSLFIWWITLINLRIWNHPHISGMKSTWSWCVIFLMYPWILFVSILLLNVIFVSLGEIGLQFSSLLRLYVVWVSGKMWPRKTNWAMFFLFLFYGITWEILTLIHLWNLGRILY